MTVTWSFTVNLHFLYNDFFSFFLLIFQLPQAQKVKLFSITFQSSPELTNHACLHGLVRSALFMTSEMVFLLGLQEPEVGQEQKDPQTWLSTSPLSTESHQRALWWPVVWGWIYAQPFCQEFSNNRWRVSLSHSFQHNIPDRPWDTFLGR